MECGHDYLAVTSNGSTTVITVTGDLDWYARSEAEQTLREVQAQGVDDLVLDLGGLGFLDSTGVSMLLSLAHTVRQRCGRVQLRNAPERALFLLDVRGGLGLFDVVERPSVSRRGSISGRRVLGRLDVPGQDDEPGRRFA